MGVRDEEHAIGTCMVSANIYKVSPEWLANQPPSDVSVGLLCSPSASDCFDFNFDLPLAGITVPYNRRIDGNPNLQKSQFNSVFQAQRSDP
jgi:hypothetical protein